MRLILRPAFGVLVMISSLGCISIYRHTVSPFTTDFGNTPVARTSPAHSDLNQIKYSYYLDVRWDSNAIGDIAKVNGIGTIYYVDSEVKNILGDEDGALFAELFNLEEGGNFRDQSTGQKVGASIPHLQTTVVAFAEKKGLDPQAFIQRLENWRAKLFEVREARVSVVPVAAPHPGADCAPDHSLAMHTR